MFSTPGSGKASPIFSLEKFGQIHRNAYVSMVACTQHVSFQLPNESTRAGCLLDGIDNADPPFQALMARVLDDTGKGGKRTIFELCDAYILPKDLVVRRRSSQEKRQSADIISSTVRYSGPGGNGAGSFNSNVILKELVKVVLAQQVYT